MSGPHMQFGPDGPGTTRPRGTDAARVESIIVTEALRGRGTENDLCRIVKQFWSPDGNLLAEDDPGDGTTRAIEAITAWAFDAETIERPQATHEQARGEIRDILYRYLGTTHA